MWKFDPTLECVTPVTPRDGEADVPYAEHVARERAKSAPLDRLGVYL